MGLLVKGKWQDQWYDTKSTNGEFVREDSQIRHWVTANGEAGITGDSGFKAESGRYHLYVSLACPWAHRTLIFRKLKQLESHISVSIVSPDMLDDGWSFDTKTGSSGDSLNQFAFLREVYIRHKPDYTGRVTVPVLWDKQQQKIVNNESADIIRMLNSAFNDITGDDTDYYPTHLQQQIDKINEKVYENVNNGVYRAGFATKQACYEQAYHDLFTTLDELDDLLSSQRYLAGAQLTEADWRLFTTLIRFDSVYYSHFKCNQQRIEDYPHLSNYVRELYQMPGVRETVDFHHIKRHYYYSHVMVNPNRIVPVGPELDYTRPHNRGEANG